MSAQEMTPERLALRRLIAVEEAASNLSRSLHELHDVCPVCEEPEGEHYADCLSGALHEALSLPEPIQGGAYPDLLSHVDAITADRDEARQEVAALRAQRDEIREAHRVEGVIFAARLEAAELERDRDKAMNGWDEWKRLALEAVAAITAKRDAEKARAEAAEAKLAALERVAANLTDTAKALRTEVARGIAIRQSEESKLARADCLESASAQILRAARGEP